MLPEKKERRFMSLMELFLLAVGLSMDAFAVAICKGLSMSRMSWKKAAVVGLYFGGFQALMPLIGYLLGQQFERFITTFAPWIAFLLLVLIGINMIWESFGEGEKCSDSIKFKEMFVLAIATSIDALAVGVSFAFLQVKIVPAISFIGVTTFVLSMIGVKVGNVFGSRYRSKAELAGGIILILIGLKIILEHLGVLNF